MVCRRPGIVPSDIERQTHRFAESPFVIFENLRSRQMSHDFLIRGSGCASFAHYAFRSGTSNRVSHHRAHTKTRTPLGGSCPDRSPCAMYPLPHVCCLISRVWFGGEARSCRKSAARHLEALCRLK